MQILDGVEQSKAKHRDEFIFQTINRPAYQSSRITRPPTDGVKVCLKKIKKLSYRKDQQKTKRYFDKFEEQEELKILYKDNEDEHHEEYQDFHHNEIEEIR